MFKFKVLNAGMVIFAVLNLSDNKDIKTLNDGYYGLSFQHKIHCIILCTFSWFLCWYMYERTLYSMSLRWVLSVDDYTSMYEYTCRYCTYMYTWIYIHTVYRYKCSMRLLRHRYYNFLKCAEVCYEMCWFWWKKSHCRS